MGDPGRRPAALPPAERPGHPADPVAPAVTLSAFAKVNLHLEVLGKRPDGAHELLTLFERVDLADTVTLEPTGRSGIEIRVIGFAGGVPADRTNLAVRAAEAYLAESGWKRGLRITLEKRIPAGGGLGGGSSDAAAVLRGLQRLTGHPLPGDRLQTIARRLGADVPFFLADVPFALGRGRGDEIEPLDLSTRLWHLLVTPDFPIATAEVYRALDPLTVRPERVEACPEPSRRGRAGPPLTRARADATLLLRALRAGEISRARQLLFNALEATAERLHPAIAQVRAAMQAAGLERPLLSGSGSTLFALCDSRQQAESAALGLRAGHPSWRCAAVTTAL